MGWSDSLFNSAPRAVLGLFARSRRKSPAPTGSDSLKGGEKKIGTGRHPLSSLFRKENPRGTTIMDAIGEIQPAEMQPAVADEGSSQVSFLAPACWPSEAASLSLGPVRLPYAHTISFAGFLHSLGEQIDLVPNKSTAQRLHGRGVLACSGDGVAGSPLQPP